MKILILILNKKFIINFFEKHFSERNTYKKHEIKLLAIEEICTLIFEKLKKRAIKFLGKEVKNAIITVPANFNITKRQIIQDSAKIAGLNVKKFIIESTAVAISYFYEKNIENEKKILFLNLGADFLSISIVLVKNNFFKVLATHGKNRFGGEDFDDILMLNKAFDSAFLKTPKYLNKLKNLCEEAKIKLSNSNEAIIEFKDFGKYSNYLNPEKFERYLFEQNCHIFELITTKIKELIKYANMNENNIDNIVLSGGSVYIQKIQEIISEFFGKKQIEICPNNSEAACMGGAIYSAYISNVKNEKISNIKIIDAIPFRLIAQSGFKEFGDVYELVPKYGNLPINNKKIIFNIENQYGGKTDLIILEEIKKYSDKEGYVKKELLCKITLKSEPKDGKKVEVNFNIDG